MALEEDDFIGELRTMPPQELIGEESLCRVTGRSRASIRRAVSRGELPMPTRLFRRSIWKVGIILSHIEKHQVKVISKIPLPPVKRQLKKKSGLLRVSDVARRLSMSDRLVRVLIEEGKLNAFNFGSDAHKHSQYRVRESEVEAFLTRAENNPKLPAVGGDDGQRLLRLACRLLLSVAEHAPGYETETRVKLCDEFRSLLGGECLLAPRRSPGRVVKEERPPGFSEEYDRDSGGA